MLEEGLYDNEPNYVRATIYERFFGVIPKAGFEIHDARLDREKLFQWITDNGFVLIHSKFIEFSDDGEERSVKYFVNHGKKAMIMVSRRFIDASKEPDPLSSEEFTERSNSKHPNKMAWVSFYSPEEKDVAEFKKVFDGFKICETSRNKLYMLKSPAYGGLELDSFPTSCDGMPLELNYGSAFLKKHENIVDCLSNKKSGLYIFHGPAGTGKTSYIKFLTTIIDTRKFIFVPNTMVAELFSPKLVDKLYSFKNSVLILEDAEICILKRDGKNNELVSGILNITDGLLKELLNISIIVTFNTPDISELDPALLRKGRLKIMNKFDLLPEADAVKLASKLGKRGGVSSSMSLADIYNLDEETGNEEATTDRRVGFR